MAMNKRLFFNLLLPEISVILLMNKMGMFSNLKKLKPLLILKLIFRFSREFVILIIFVKLINLSNLKNNTSLKKWLLMQIRTYMTLLVLI